MKIICIYAPANSGKTKSIRRVDEILQSYGATHQTLFDNTDFAREYMFRNRKIGILSEGDPNSRQVQTLDTFVKNHCEFIICTSRSHGPTCDAVTNIKGPNDELIWISPLYEYSKHLNIHIDMHEFNAKLIIKALLSKL